MKNVKKSILVLSMCTVATLFGQTTAEVQFETNTDSTAIEEVSYEYLLAHRVHLREQPSLTAKRVTALNIGTRLSLWEESANYEELNGVKSHWYLARIGSLEGWVWGGMIAQKTLGSQTDYDVKFVYGLESVRMNDEGSVEERHQIRAFKNGRELDKYVFDGYGDNLMEIQNVGSKGLSNVDDILTLDIPSVEHASPIGTMYLFWNNGKFQNVASLIDYSTATYSKSESFVFPSDMEGLKSTIILETTISDHNGAVASEGTKGNRKLVVSFFGWDGHKLIQKEALPAIATDLAVNN